VVDATQASGAQPALCAFVGGDAAIGWSEQPEHVRRELVLEHLVSLFGAAAREPITILEKDWATEPYNGGCPVGTSGPGVLAIGAHALRTPHRRVVFAGTELATVWPGFLNGAVQSGQRAADEVAVLLAGGVIAAEEFAPDGPVAV
jgi:monoamine oxidase